MKKVFLIPIITIVFSLPFTLEVFAFSINPTSGTISQGYLDDNQAILTDIVNLYSYKATSPLGTISDCITGFSVNNNQVLGIAGGWTGISVWDSVGTWTITEFSDDSCAVLSSTKTFILSNPSNFQQVINNSDTTFNSSMGFDRSNVGSFMWSMGSLVLGSAMGFLYFILPYISALVIIGAIVYLLYRAFRFLKH